MTDIAEWHIVEFPDWSKAKVVTKTITQEVEVLAVDQPYRMNHDGRVVEALPGDYLVRYVDDPDSTFSVSADQAVADGLAEAAAPEAPAKAPARAKSKAGQGS